MTDTTPRFGFHWGDNSAWAGQRRDEQSVTDVTSVDKSSVAKRN